MRRLTLFAALLVPGMGWAGTEPDSTGMAGDNLDLFGVLELFQKAESVEAFEKALNTESNQVNNLDLNGDGEVDYIRVVDHSDKDAHALVLQVPVNEKESQDVATIELEKTGDASAQLQVVGDEDIYGKEYFVEPNDEKTKFMPGVMVNVWMWPCVRFIYGPKYVVWVSPWRWRAYPAWYKPWRPVAWRIHHRRVVRYHAMHYHRVRVHRVVRAHRVYHRHRVVSQTVRKRHAVRTAPPGQKARVIRKNKPNQRPASRQKAGGGGGKRR